MAQQNVLNSVNPGLPAGEVEEAFRLLQQAEKLRARGELDRARTVCEPLVHRYPDYFGALQTLGLIYADKGQHPQALGCLVRASMLNPRSWQALTALSGVYLELGASEMAARTLEQARKLKADDPAIPLTLAEIYHSEREHGLALGACRAAYDLDRNYTPAAIGMANSLLELGEYEEAATILEDLIRRGTRTLPVLALVDQLPAGMIEFDILSALDATTAEPGADRNEFENSRMFVRASVLHKAGRHDEAWQSLTAANRQLWLRAESHARELAATQRANLEALKHKRISAGKPRDRTSAPVSLFILGASRSGKTTAESLAGTLDAVKRGYENPAVENAVRRTFQTASLLTHRMLDVLPEKLDDQFRAFYLEELSERAGDAKVFTNTHPARIHDVARIAAIVPNARFLFVKRDLDDTLLRIYMRKYTRGNADSYDLKAARGSILWYHRMIDVLAEKLPDVSRVLQYEEVIEDPRAALRATAELCGLPAHEKPLPPLGDDRNCAEPYREVMAAALRD